MKTENFKKKFLINFLIILAIFSFDRFTKLYVIYLDKKFFGSELFSSKFLNIILVWNDGIAFGLFSFENDSFYNILTIFIFIIILVIIFMIIKSEGLKKYSLLMVVGGALGNFFDRLLNKSVPDFIDFHIGDYHWFIFNIADVFITIGVIFVILLEITDNNKELKL